MAVFIRQRQRASHPQSFFFYLDSVSYSSTFLSKYSLLVPSPQDLSLSLLSKIPLLPSFLIFIVTR